MPPEISLPLGAVFGDPAPIGFGERAPERGGVEIPAVRRRARLLAPGVIQITTVDGLEAKIVDEAKHGRLGVRRIAGDRKSDAPLRPPWLSSMPRSIASIRPSRSSGW